MKRVYWIAITAIITLVLIVGGFAYIQASNERVVLMSDLQYRTRLLSDSLEEAITPSVRRQATSSVQRIITRIANNERIAGIAVFDNTGSITASEKVVPNSSAIASLIRNAMDSAQPSSQLISDPDVGTIYVYATPLRGEGQSVSIIGALTIVQGASYIDETIGGIWWRNVQRLLALIILMTLTIVGLVYWVFRRPIMHLSETLQAVRRGDMPEDSVYADGFLAPLAQEISKVTSSLYQARMSASEEARMRLEKLDTPWTSGRLKEFIKAYVKGRPIYVLSNAEPYVHRHTKKGIECHMPPGGPVAALDPIMEATGGMWIAYGRGDADKEVSDAEGKLRVPPDEPSYTLKRVWLNEQEVKGYYDGFSNEAMYPLCLMVHVRPIFRKEDWQTYKQVNVKFATTLLEEIRGVERPIVLVHDYHLALVPALIKKARPDAQVAIFWHTPWPSAAQFSICPWRKEILEGMLGADLIGFHTQQHCNNFMDTVAAEIESRIDFEHFTIYRSNHGSVVRPFPISIAFPHDGKPPRSPEWTLKALGIRSERFVLGVDRLDYTKGLMERLKGIEHFFAVYPEFREKVTFLQIVAPSRETVEKYREYAAQVAAEVARINERFGTRDWKPVVSDKRSYSHSELAPLYANADACIVTSLHDGMNLVAKEYVAARSNDTGALILSNFTGASRDLKGALVINPYSAEETAEAIHTALTMARSEQHRRMKVMREAVSRYNVYRWSAEIIKALIRLD